MALHKFNFLWMQLHPKMSSSWSMQEDPSILVANSETTLLIAQLLKLVSCSSQETKYLVPLPTMQSNNGTMGWSIFKQCQQLAAKVYHPNSTSWVHITSVQRLKEIKRMEARGKIVEVRGGFGHKIWCKESYIPMHHQAMTVQVIPSLLKKKKKKIRSIIKYINILIGINLTTFHHWTPITQKALWSMMTRSLAPNPKLFSWNTTYVVN